MAELIVTLKQIQHIKIHPNADNLDILYCGGWQLCEKKGRYHIGDNVVFIPPDAILPKKLHEFLQVTTYCASLPANSNEAQAGMRRVKAVRLRGEPSFGLLMSCEQFLEYAGYDLNQDCYGVDLKPYLGIVKYEPPEVLHNGDGERPHTYFNIYTDIQHYGNYHDVLVQNEEVVMLEKVHGANLRMGLINEMDTWTYMCGTHRVRRRQYDKQNNLSASWKFLDNNIKELMDTLKVLRHAQFSVIVYAETYGPVQDMKYGSPNEAKAVVFDIAVDGQYLDYDEMRVYCHTFDIKTVPIAYRGPYTIDAVIQNTSGPTLMCSAEEAGRFKGREGVVIRPVKERTHPRLGRVILKSVSADYLARKNPIDNPG